MCAKWGKAKSQESNRRKLEQATKLGALNRTRARPIGGLQRRVKQITTERFTRVFEFIRNALAADLGLPEAEVEKRIRAGTIEQGDMRLAFFSYGVERGAGRHSKIIAGDTSGVGSRSSFGPAAKPAVGINEALAGAERAAQDRLRRLLHLPLDSPSGVAIEGDSAVIALLPPRDPSNRPLTHRGLTSAMTSFFDGLEREKLLQYGRLDDPIKPFSRSYRQQLRLFADLLHNKLYLSDSAQRKHILSAQEIDQVLAAIWKAGLSPISTMNLQLIATLEVQTGLRPGEFSRDDSDISIEPGKRRSNFTWADVFLTYHGRLEQETSTGQSLQPYFFLTIEWEGGKKRKVGEFIPTNTGSQPPLRAHLCPVRWLLLIGLWYGVFHKDHDSKLRAVLFGEDTADVPDHMPLQVDDAWLNVPVLLADRSPLSEEQHKLVAHKKVLEPWSYNDGKIALKKVAGVLGWDNLVFYDFRRTFATTKKGQITDEHLALLLGHRDVETMRHYVSRHPAIDQSALVSGADASRATTSLAQEAATRSHGLATPKAPSSLFSNAYVKHCQEALIESRRKCNAIPALASRLKRLALDLYDDNSAADLPKDQSDMLADLAERETDLLAAIGMVGNKDHRLTLAARVSALRGAKASTTTSAAATTNAAPALPVQLDAAEQQWLDQLIQNGSNPIEDTTMETFFRRMGGYLEEKETENQGLCILCLEWQPRNRLEGTIAASKLGPDFRLLFKSHGLSYTDLTCLQMQTALLRYHRTREVPLAGLEPLQLKKLCDIRGMEESSYSNLDKVQLLELLTLHLGSDTVPNGLLDDGSGADASLSGVSAGSSRSLEASSADALDSEAQSPRKKTRFTKGADGKRRVWQNDVPLRDRMTLGETLRRAIRAGVKIEKVVGLDRISIAEVEDLINAAKARPGWTPVSPWPQTYEPLQEGRTSGTFEGVAPITRCVDSLAAAAQGLDGLGRLGIINKSKYLPRFMGRAHQEKHSIDHMEELNPGLLHCWLCRSWYIRTDDPDHDSRCRERHFGEQDQPVPWDAFVIECVPQSGSLQTQLYLSFSAPTKVAHVLRDALYNLVSALSKKVSKKGDKRQQTRSVLIEQASYNCPVPLCHMERPSFSSLVHHLAHAHRVPIVRKGNTAVFDYDATLKIRTYNNKDDGKQPRLWFHHPQYVESEAEFLASDWSKQSDSFRRGSD